MFKLLQVSAAPVSSESDRLTAGYAELQGLDQALRDAEQNLKTAHSQFAKRQGPRPDGLYSEVLRLRQQSRHLLDQLADLVLREELRESRSIG
jgi:hypothetical protein